MKAGTAIEGEHGMRSLENYHRINGLAASAAALLLAVHSIAPAVAQNADGARECRDEQGLTYICNLVVPEDVVNVGSTGLVLVSGHRAPGHLYLVDPATNTPIELIHGPTFRQQRDMNLFGECPASLNLAAFDVHGISITETSPRRFVLYTTSHGEREAIEVYQLDLAGDAPRLTWTGCVMLQQDGYFNAVVRLADGGFIATRMRDAGVSNNAIAPGQITGRLFEWHPGSALTEIAGTELSLPNGLDASADGRYVYVAATGTQELVRFDRSTSPATKRAVSLPMRPDNVHWDANGKLIVAGTNPAPAGCSAAACAAGWTVVEADPDTLAFSRLGGADGRAAMQRVSAAIRLGNDIWVGSNEDRIARFSLD
jgi:hypothetical protein